MDYHPVATEENDLLDGPIPSLSPYLEYESQDDQNNTDKPSRWSHQKDLDEFFSRIYQYHQKHGFLCIVLSEVYGLIQFVFIVSFTIFVLQCIDYPLLFRSTPSARNITEKIKINQIIIPPKKCLPQMHLITSLCFILAVVYWFYRFSRAIHNLLSYFNIRTFYTQVLDIKPNELSNMTWHEVQQRLLIAQPKHHLCIHKTNLTELDIHNRLLRFKNYEVALVNKGLLPLKLHLPVFGDIISLTASFKFNLRLILFWGPFAPFDQRWHIRQEYKIYSQREILSRQLSRFILLYGIINLLLSPFIFIWQMLNLFYGYTELIRREPGVLGNRRWSNYGRLYLRHFNELDHSLNQRLNRGHKPAMHYMGSFLNYGLIESAKFIGFMTGAILAVLIILTVYDEDVLNVEHMLTLMTGLGVIIGICRSLIPDENAVFDPEQMLHLVLAQVHYQPDSWKDNSHKDYVQLEFGQMFQLKYVYFVEELLSPFVTPILLCYHLRRKSLQIIDFLRNYTIDVQGVGDVCSFAQLDIAKYGDLKWFAPVRAKLDNEAGVTNDGKLELSLMHFHHTNPKWKMPKQCEVYLEKIQELAVENITTSSVLQQSFSEMRNLQFQNSVYSNQDSIKSSTVDHSMVSPRLVNNRSTYSTTNPSQHVIMNISNQKPITTSTAYNLSTTADLPYRTLPSLGILSKIHSQMYDLSDSNYFPGSLASVQGLPGAAHLDMNVSCLFMHELRRKYRHGEYIELNQLNEDRVNDDAQC